MSLFLAGSSAFGRGTGKPRPRSVDGLVSVGVLCGYHVRGVLVSHSGMLGPKVDACAPYALKTYLTSDQTRVPVARGSSRRRDVLLSPNAPFTPVASPTTPPADARVSTATKSVENCRIAFSGWHPATCAGFGLLASRIAKRFTRWVDLIKLSQPCTRMVPDDKHEESERL